ncbi:unnamed protein product [Symbiodinium sp. KB8]|nr:unnamed protein product [Symbiodinium sp. KB8]
MVVVVIYHCLGMTLGWLLTRITFSRAARLSTPLRGNLAAALEDWHAVRSARGEARADRLQRHEMAAVWSLVCCVSLLNLTPQPWPASIGQPAQGY